MITADTCTARSASTIIETCSTAKKRSSEGDDATIGALRVPAVSGLNVIYSTAPIKT
jgi:hypothetical protein